MRYLVSFLENNIRKSFYTNWYESSNNFDIDLDMIVFDFSTHKFSVDGINWIDIEEDHL
jgi:hypothetical protein